MQRIKTILLLTTLSGLLLLLGTLLGGTTGLQLALCMAIAMNGIAYFFSDKLVLNMYGAQPLDPVHYAWIYEMVDELAYTMNIPRPKLWLIKTPMANAFATGRNPQNASVAVTTGILNILERHELRGVLAHELAHVYNRDILVTTIAATIATAIGYLAHSLQYIAFWGAHDNRRRDGNPLVMIMVAILMPIAATLMQLAVSRSREYLADETGAHHCKDPLALASALEKLHNHIPHAHLNSQDMQQASTASLFIVHPFNGEGLIGLFATHPPMHKRIERLHKIHQKLY
ncbi:MAG TPA: M48 family metalloprotease [Candidatus Limnocylindria bacterium]|nr:M48 family metalloprotease [Candidatus Limnocylindria bacterium]